MSGARATAGAHRPQAAPCDERMPALSRVRAEDAARTMSLDAYRHARAAHANGPECGPPE
ncbi:hypothetical protein DP43_4955 [Burkholderia pseudomallei]|nr:hypothetical protein DP43_4955 [Burkholderia pseudomallei]